ncbi:MAG: DUF2202 domain-containing protein [Ignavibacteriales bacterium]|nr:DUF2202 domain-containing protein [Ignavibacteriales bacterium]
MKKLTSKILGLVLLAFVLFGCNANTDVVSPESDLSKSSNSELINFDGGVYPITQEEIDGLIHMRIEEKLARDVYTVLGTAYNSQVFLNIKLSEQAHMNAVKRMLDKYNIPDPLTSDEVGVFPDPNFQALYDQLIAQGSVSLYEGLLVGKAIEELDIADLEAQLAFVTNPGIVNLYTNLKAGSVSHLAAFERNLVGCINTLAID